MARRRHFAPDQDLVHVSFKCVGDAFLMRPDAYTSFVIASALEQAAEKYGVRIHAFCFLSNHAHLLLGIQDCRLDSFMQYLKSLSAQSASPRGALRRGSEAPPGAAWRERSDEGRAGVWGPMKQWAFFKRRYRARGRSSRMTLRPSGSSSTCTSRR
jgi:REP element-mobilizing transposase RayT